MSLATGSKLPLVGRADELAALEKMVRRARSGGRIAVVEGEAGIGKTRLLQAALETAAAGLTVLSSRAEELDAHRPFGAIVDLAGSDRLEANLGAWNLAPDTAGERQFLVAETLLDMLDELCAIRPVAVVVEDLHWADPATLGVLARLAAGIEQLPAVLLVSARPLPRRVELERLLTALTERRASTLRLGPLDNASVREFLEALLDAAPGERLLRQTRRAGGNPLFVAELVGALLADGAIVCDGRRAELPEDAATPSLAVTILHRLSALPPPVLELLELASVLGASFTAPDLALLARRPVAELVPALLAARRSGVLTERGDRLAFQHELIRDVLYEDMPGSAKRGLHTRLADSFAEAGEPPERIAEHLLRGASHGDERAIRSLIVAARELVGRAPGAAVDLYGDAIELSADPRARRRELLPELALALVAAGHLGDGEAACREALAGDPGPEAAGGLWLQLMFLLLRRARTAEAVAEGQAALATPRLGGVERVRVRALLAMARVFQRQVEQAAEDARAVLEDSDDEVARALATNTLAVTADARGRFSEAAELMEPSVRWADQTVSRAAYDTRPHMIYGIMLTRVDKLDEARATMQRGRRGAERLGIADALPIFHYQLAFAYYLEGHLDDAHAELQAHAALADQTAVGWMLPTHSLRALIAIHRDDLPTAERLVEAAGREAAQGGPAFGTDLMVLARARVLVGTGHQSEALEATAAAYEAIVAERGFTFLPVVGLELARLAAGARAPARAASLVDALDEIARANRGVRSLAAAPLQARGLLESDGDALLAAVELLRGTARRLETARALEDAAGVARPRRELLEEARAIYDRCGAVRDLARVDAALRGLGTRSGAARKRRPRPATGWEALTETELKIVRLVAARLSNPEIAERMFISRRTVQTHVSHALAKVGVSTRRELAAEAARRRGWRFRADGVFEDPEQPEPALEGTQRTGIDADRA